MIEVELVSYTPNPELAIAIAARTCLSNQNYKAISEKLNDADIERIITTAIAKNHQSVLEHANFTFSISGVSRVLTHQLVRHRIASYSQLSQQRTDSSHIDFVTPPEIKKATELDMEYREMLNKCQELYKKMLCEHISRGSARYILPVASTTRIIATLNARSLINLLQQRECDVEEWEFRQVALLMHNELIRVAPRVFNNVGAPCEMTYICPEGEAGRKCKRRNRNGALLANPRAAINRDITSGVI